MVGFSFIRDVPVAKRFINKEEHLIEKTPSVKNGSITFIDNSINCCIKHVDLYLKNKQLFNDNTKLQKKFNELYEMVQQFQNYTDANSSVVSNKLISTLHRKIELLTQDLQEEKDEKELMEFRFLELKYKVETMAETYNYYKTKEQRAFRKNGFSFKNVTRTSSGLSSDEGSSVLDTTLSLDELKDQDNLIKKDDLDNSLFVSSPTFLTSEDEGLYRSEEDAFSGPSSLENRSKITKIKDVNEINKIEKTICNKSVSERSTSPFLNINELEDKIIKLEKKNNELIEQNLELEEAENDARLESQKLKIKVDNLLEEIDELQTDLDKSCNYLKNYQNQISDFKKREIQLVEQIKVLENKLDSNIQSKNSNNSSESCDLENDKLNKNSFIISMNNPKDCSKINERHLNFGLKDTKIFEKNNNDPICNTIEPVKIDLCSNLKTNENDESKKSKPNCIDDDNNTKNIKKNLNQLETNQEELRDRLQYLQMVNKEFVKDLEQRENILTRKELHFKEWITKESILRRTIVELNSELDELNKNFNFSQRQRDELRAKCDELHLQLTELETGILNQNTNEESLLSTRQKDVHELILSCKQQNCDQRLIELINKFKMQFDEQCTKEMEREEHIQTVLDKFCARDIELQEEMKNLYNKQAELKDQIHRQEKNLNKLNKFYEEGIDQLEKERIQISCKLKQTILVMENCTFNTVEELQTQRNQITQNLNDAFKSYKTSQENYQKCIEQLENQININTQSLNDLKNKNSINQQVNGNFEDQLLMSANDQLLNIMEQKAVNAYKEEQMNNLLQERDDLKQKVSILEECFEQYKQKEDAYKETLIKADKLFSEKEYQYKKRIEQLELNEKQLNERLISSEKMKPNNYSPTIDDTFTCLSTNKSSLLNQVTCKSAVAGLTNSQQLQRNNELLNKLLNSESRECSLKEKISKLEQNEANLKLSLEKLINENKALEDDLLEIDSLNRTIEKLRKDLHLSMQQLDKEREKNCHFNLLLEQKELDYKRDFNEMLNENKNLQFLIEQQNKIKFLNQQTYKNIINSNYIDVNYNSNPLKRSNEMSTNNHVLKIAINETEKL